VFPVSSGFLLRDLQPDTNNLIPTGFRVVDDRETRLTDPGAELQPEAKNLHLLELRPTGLAVDDRATHLAVPNAELQPPTKNLTDLDPRRFRKTVDRATHLTELDANLQPETKNQHLLEQQLLLGPTGLKVDDRATRLTDPNADLEPPTKNLTDLDPRRVGVVPDRPLAPVMPTS